MPPILDSTGSTFNRGDFTATNAFLWSSIDVSAYAGTDTGYTPFYVEALDGASKKATGYIGAVGAGETLGNELIGNTTFDDNSWWEWQASWSVVGGVAVSNGTGWIKRVDFFNVNFLYKREVTVTEYTSGDGYGLYNGASYSLDISSAGLKSSYINYNVVGPVYIYGSLYVAKIDNPTIKRVTDPPSTAVHIVSSFNGTTRNWASIESGFDPNNIASWGIYDSSTLLSPSVSPSAEPTTGGTFIIFRRRRR